MSRTPRAWATRLGGVVGAALLCAGIATPMPAVAQVPPYAAANLQASAIAVGVNESSAGKNVVLYVFGCCPEDDLPGRVSVKVDAGPAAGVLVVRVSGGDCAVAGRATTCDIPFQQAFKPDGDLRVNLKVASGAAVGAVGNIKLTVSGDGLNTTTTDNEITVVASAADIVAKSFTFPDIKPHDVRSFQPTFTNSGDQAAKVVVLRMFNDPFARFTHRYRNCLYDDSEFGTSVYCEFELNLAVGEWARVTADTAVAMKVQPDVPSKWFTGAGYGVDVFDSLPGIGVGEPGNGAELRFEKFTPGPEVKLGDADFVDSQGNLLLQTGINPADMAAIGTTVAGAPGTVLPVRVGIKNNGPAYVLGQLDGEGLSADAPAQPAATVTFPAGVTVGSLPPEEPRDGVPFCAPIIDGKADYSKRNQPIGLVYRCTASADISVGETWIFDFTVRITGSVNAPGTIVASGGHADPNSTNNTAPITINGGGTGGGLPVTGTRTGVIASLGAAALLLGAALYVIARRRRLVA